MTKEIIKLYEDFFNTIEKDKISYIYKAYPKVDEVFNNIINNLENFVKILLCPQTEQSIFYFLIDTLISPVVAFNSHLPPSFFQISHFFV